LQDDGTYLIDGKNLNTEELIVYYEELVKKYPVCSIEDGLGENDWEGLGKFSLRRLGDKIQLVGDDLLVTNPELVRKGIVEKAANSVLIKTQPDRHGYRNYRRYQHRSQCGLDLCGLSP